MQGKTKKSPVQKSIESEKACFIYLLFQTNLNNKIRVRIRETIKEQLKKLAERDLKLKA